MGTLKEGRVITDGFPRLQLTLEGVTGGLQLCIFQNACQRLFDIEFGEDTIDRLREDFIDHIVVIHGKLLLFKGESSMVVTQLRKWTTIDPLIRYAAEKVLL